MSDSQRIRLTKYEKAAIVDCLAHCEAAGTELDFMGSLTELQREALAQEICSALFKVVHAGWSRSDSRTRRAR